MLNRKLKSLLNKTSEIVHLEHNVNFYQKLTLIREICRSYSYNTKLVFSDKIITHIVELDQGLWQKPYGIWYSYGGIWIDFLLSNAYGYHQKWAWKRLENIRAIYKIKLNYDNILRIKKYNDFIKFNKLYGIRKNKMYYMNGTYKLSSNFKYRHLIDWNAVSNDYCGIQIRCNTLSFVDFFWYDDWDISSGCIWHKNAVNDLKLLVRFS